MYKQFDVIEQENGEDDYIDTMILNDSEAWKHEKDMKDYIKKVYGYKLDEFISFSGYKRVATYNTTTY